MSPSYWTVRTWTVKNRRAATYCQTPDIVAGSGDAFQSIACRRHSDRSGSAARLPPARTRGWRGKREARRYRVGRKIRHSVDNVWAAGTPGRIADLRGNSRRDNAAFQNRLVGYGD